MSANADTVTRIYEDGLMDGDPSALWSLADPEIELVNPPEAIEGGVRRGNEVAQAWVSMQESFDSTRHELREVFDGGDVVVAAIDFCTRSRGSQAEVRQFEAHTWTFRGGKILRFEWGRDLEAALAAAGIDG